MRIVIDARMYGPHFTGIGRYIEELIENLEELDDHNDYVVLLAHVNYESYRPGQGNFRKVLVSFPHYSLREQLLLPALLHRLRPDVVHFPANFAPVFFRGRRVTTVHDLTAFRYPPSLRPGFMGGLLRLKRLPARFLMFTGAHLSDRIVTDSEYVAGEIRSMYSIPEGRVSVVYPGSRRADWGALSAPSQLPPTPFLLYVGTCYPHKNVGTLLEAMVDLRLGHPDLHLLIVGRTDHANDLMRQRARDLGIDDRVRFLGRVSDPELGWLYRNAMAYVFPSLSEGFGLPGLEALSAGTPVIAARASCLPEVYGPAAAYMHPTDAAQMAADISDAISSPEVMKRMGDQGPTYVTRYSYATMARQTLEVYEATSRSMARP